MRNAIVSAVMAGAVAALVPSAFAAERVTLSNGFAMDCNHHALVDGHVRLYLSAGQDSYIEMRPEEVTRVELVPDATVDTSQAASQATTEETKLSPIDLREILAEAGQSHNLDVDLLASVVKAESDGNAHAVSRAGARGLMQLMPRTASDLGVDDSFKPGENVRGGSVYLDSLLTRYHENLAMALAAYNAGPAAVDKYHGIPPYHETRVYVARVIHEFNRRVRAREAEARQNMKLTGSQAALPR
ncbi:MAG TPA: lytic transglycosylase domain-containing protein [Terracidiphilus sp.]|jgi:soluble lytic murein transglycosylase-like protein|nr:lytic transglycosylase domain-containing protein [Terracidiphilus sp.]